MRVEKNQKNETKKPRRLMPRSAKAPAAALASLLSATPTFPQTPQTINPDNTTQVSIPQTPHREPRIEDRKSSSFWLEQFDHWANEEYKNNHSSLEGKTYDKSYMSAFFKYFEENLVSLSDKNLQKRIFLDYLTTFDRYGSAEHWSYTVNDDYKKIENFFSKYFHMSGTETFTEILSQKGGRRFLFEKVFSGHEGSEKDLEGTIWSKSEDLNKISETVYETFISNMDDFLSIHHTQFEETRFLKLLKLFYPHFTPEQKQSLKNQAEIYFKKASFSTKLFISDQLLTFLGLTNDPLSYKLGVMKKSFDEVDESTEEEFLDNLSLLRSSLFTNKPHEIERQETVKKIYAEALRVLVRQALHGKFIFNHNSRGNRISINFSKSLGPIKPDISLDASIIRDHENQSSWLSKLSSEDTKEFDKMIFGSFFHEGLKIFLRDFKTFTEVEVHNMFELLKLYKEKSETKMLLTDAQIADIISNIDNSTVKASILVNARGFAENQTFINKQLDRVIASEISRGPIHGVSLVQKLLILDRAQRNFYSPKFQEILKLNPDTWTNIKADSKEMKLFVMFQKEPHLLDAINAIALLPYSSLSGRGREWSTINPENLNDIFLKLEAGYAYILPKMYELNRGVILEPDLIDHMLRKKIPLRNIVYSSILISRNHDLMYPGFNYSNASAKLWWRVLGKKYEKFRKVEPGATTNIINMLSSGRVGTDLMHRIDSRSRYKDLQILDINDPASYLDIFEYVSGVANGVLWNKMYDTLNFLEFDKLAKQKIKAGDLTGLVDTVRRFGNVLDPRLTRSLLRRVVKQNQDEIIATFKAWGFENSKDGDKPKFYLIDSKEKLYRLETLGELLLQSNEQIFFGDRTDDKHLNFTPKLEFKFDLSFLNDQGSIEEMMNLYSKFSNSMRSFLYLLADINDLTVDNEVKKALRYLRDAIVTKATNGGVGIESISATRLEEIRNTLNEVSRNSGNELLSKIFSDFMDKMEKNETINGESSIIVLRNVIIGWHNLLQGATLQRDVRETYRQMINFSFYMFLDKIKNRSDRETLITPLRSLGYDFEPEPDNLAKATSGNYSASQIANKIIEKVTLKREERVNISKIQFEEGMREGATAEYICTTSECTKDNAEAVILLGNSDKVGISLEVNSEGIVNTTQVKKQLGERYIASAPEAFTAGGRVILDLAYANGVEVGSHIKYDGRDGFTVTNKEGKLIILNKRDMDLSKFDELGVKISSEILQKLKEENRPFNPVKIWSHRVILNQIMLENKLNAVTNMLLADNGQQVGKPILDGSDSRRFLVKMKDGRFGIISSIKPMSTDKLVKIALACGANTISDCNASSQLVYMDTGMYDSFDIVTKDKTTHVLGHRDTDASTQRLFLWYRN